MRAGRISAARTKIEDGNKAEEAREARMEEMKQMQINADENNLGVSQNDEQMLITNERK